MNSEEEEQNYLSELSDISMRSTDYKQMLRDSLELILDIFSCDRAWLLYPADPNVEEYSIPIMRCRDDWYIPEGLTLPMDDYTKQVTHISLNNKLPTAFYKSKEPYIPENIIKDHHVQSLLVTSIDPKVDMKWVFGIHQCTNERDWSDNEIDFFKRISERIRDGLRSLLVLHKLKESEDKYRTIFESSGDAIILLDPQKGFVDCNAAALKMFSVPSKEEFYKLTPLHLSPEFQPNGSLSSECAEKELIKTQKEGRNVFEWTHKDLDGREFPASVVITPLELNGKKILQGTIRDITERKQAEEELEKTQAFLTAALSQSASGIIIADAQNGKITFANAAAFGIRGQTNTLLTTIEISEHSENWKTFYLDGKTPYEPEKLPLSRAILEGVTSENVELIIRTEDGEDRIVTTNASPIRDKDGEIISGIVIFHDVTARKQIEESLRKAQSYISNIINSMPSALIGVDSDGTITQWNSKAQRITDISMEEAVGQPLGQAIPRLNDKMEHVHEAMRTKQVLSESRLIHKEGSEMRYEDVTIYPLIAEEDKGAVIRIDDVTDRVHLEDMMIQSEKMSSVAALAAGMAHEINNPLGSILQGYQNILNRINPEKEINQKLAEQFNVNINDMYAYLIDRRILTFINGGKAACERAAQIINNMLMFSRKTDSSQTMTNLVKLIDHTIELGSSDYDMKKRYDFKFVDIIKEYEPQLPMVNCCSTEIEQVLLNIFKNALQAMEEVKGEEYKPQFHVRLIKEPKYIRIEIQDNGPGIPDDVKHRIFEPFFTTKAVGTGTGLGLSVSYMIITQNHGGTFEVETEHACSHENLGPSACGMTKFIIRLPI